MKKMKKDGFIRIRCSYQELNKLKDLQRIMGFKSLASFIRFIINDEIARLGKDEDHFKEFYTNAIQGNIPRTVVPL
jgi:hypothetical protein